MNMSAIQSQEDYNTAAAAAAFIGTLQAGYTDFHYLNPKWKIACEEDALLGVSMTGIASGNIDILSKHVAAHAAIQTNQDIAKRIGINPAARITTVKPEGTSSLVLGTSSGIHSWHAPTTSGVCVQARTRHWLNTCNVLYRNWWKRTFTTAIKSFSAFPRRLRKEQSLAMKPCPSFWSVSATFLRRGCTAATSRGTTATTSVALYR